MATDAATGSHPARIAYLGPPGTFSDQAAETAAPRHERLPMPSILDVIDAVRTSRCDLGVVPLENSIEGSVTTTIDELAFGESGVAIRGELNLPVTMHLMARPGTELAEVGWVRSHPHALAQVRRWLTDKLPDAEEEPVASTAEAARQAAASAGVAAVGNEVAAQRYGLEVLAASIQDHDANATRFGILGRELAPASGADKTSIVVFLGPDRPGLLRQILDEFASRGINLTRIESRPTKQRLGEYCMHIDCIGHLTEARVGEALRGLHRHVAGLRVLGSYARADADRDEPRAADSDEAYAEAVEWYEGLLRTIG